MLRTMAICLAMATDFLDGYISRQYKQSSQLGTLLDPLMDKLFVFVVVSVLIAENKLTPGNVGAMFCRDFAVIIFGFYLFFKGTLLNYRFKSIWSGKLTTTLQFIVLIALTNHYILPPQIFPLFIGLGVLALVELYLIDLQRKNGGKSTIQ